MRFTPLSAVTGATWLIAAWKLAHADGLHVAGLAHGLPSLASRYAIIMHSAHSAQKPNSEPRQSMNVGATRSTMSQVNIIAPEVEYSVQLCSDVS
jgi:hypothetical protein